jgi:hypothetical protein
MVVEWLSPKLGRSVVLYGEGRAHYYWHWCPACMELHHYTVVLQEPWRGPHWSSAGTYNAPTFSPSMKITWGKAPESCCHYFLTDGMIQYQGDCTHAMKGHTVALPDVPEKTRDFYSRMEA